MYKDLNVLPVFFLFVGIKQTKKSLVLFKKKEKEKLENNLAEPHPISTEQ